MTVCHIGTLPLERMGKITLDIIRHCNGLQVYSLLSSEIHPYSDIYVLHCFKNHHKEFINFKQPHNNCKIISLVHSSYPCMPAKESDCVITLTNYWREKLLREKGIDSHVIYGGIKIPDVKADLENKWFGRIVRDDKGKFHPAWNRTAKKILDAVPDSRMYIISNNVKKKLKHPRAIYNSDIQINDEKNKMIHLAELSVAVFANGSFEEIFPMAVLECMAVGLPIIYLYQPSMAEMVWTSGNAFWNIKSLGYAVEKLLEDNDAKIRMSKDSIERARFFSLDKMISSWNKLFQEVYNGTNVTKSRANESNKGYRG